MIGNLAVVSHASSCLTRVDMRSYSWQHYYYYNYYNYYNYYYYYYYYYY